VKQRAVREHAARYRLRTLIETGTYYGEMVSATISLFDSIQSIECDPALAALAQARFARHPNVRILCGDSQTVIPKLLGEVRGPCLFWLDAGYYGWAGLRGETERLGAEINAILNHPIREHVILMDDARGLNGENGAPSLQDFIQTIRSRDPHRQIAVLDDIVRIVPAAG
jgi:hypothetical protein